MPVALPPLAEQRRIAGVLRAYDEAIENCRRQISLLEEAAQRLYKEWFREEKGTRGPISDWFDVTIGRTPDRKVLDNFSTDETDMPWCSISDLKGSSVFVFDTTEKLTRKALSESNIHISPKGSVLLSFKLTVGRVGIAATDMATNEAIAHFETDDLSLRNYTYCFLRNFEYGTLGSTSAIGTAINSKIVKGIPFLMPEKQQLDQFSKTASPVFESLFTLERQARLFAEARDRLLPRLLSGEASA